MNIEYLNALQKKYANEFSVIDGLIDDYEIISSSLYYCIDQAEHKIIDYMNWQTYDNAYYMAKITLAMLYYRHNLNIAKEIKGTPALSSYSEGSRSETYKGTDIEFDDDGLTAEIKAMLPKPLLRVI